MAKSVVAMAIRKMTLELDRSDNITESLTALAKNQVITESTR
jgi:hypothetical protein